MAPPMQPAGVVLLAAAPVRCSEAFSLQVPSRQVCVPPWQNVGRTSSGLAQPAVTEAFPAAACWGCCSDGWLHPPAAAETTRIPGLVNSIRGPWMHTAMHAYGRPLPCIAVCVHVGRGAVRHCMAPGAWAAGPKLAVQHSRRIQPASTAELGVRHLASGSVVTAGCMSTCVAAATRQCSAWQGAAAHPAARSVPRIGCCQHGLRLCQLLDVCSTPTCVSSRGVMMPWSTCSRPTP